MAIVTGQTIEAEVIYESDPKKHLLTTLLLLSSFVPMLTHPQQFCLSDWLGGARELNYNYNASKTAETADHLTQLLCQLTTFQRGKLKEDTVGTNALVN